MISCLCKKWGTELSFPVGESTRSWKLRLSGEGFSTGAQHIHFAWLGLWGQSGQQTDWQEPCKVSRRGVQNHQGPVAWAWGVWKIHHSQADKILAQQGVHQERAEAVQASYSCQHNPRFNADHPSHDTSEHWLGQSNHLGWHLCCIWPTDSVSIPPVLQLHWYNLAPKG